MNGIGPYNENSDYPYSEDNAPSIVNKNFTESEYYEVRNSSVAKITGVFQAHINNNSDNDEFKQLIMDYGAASLSYNETIQIISSERMEAVTIIILMKILQIML